MINHTISEKKENSLCGKNVTVEVKKKKKSLIIFLVE